MQPITHKWLPLGARGRGLLSLIPQGTCMREQPCQCLPAWQRCSLCQQHRSMFSVWQRFSSCPPPHFLSHFPSQKLDFTKRDKENRGSSEGKAKVSKVRQSTGLANDSNKSAVSTKYQKESKSILKCAAVRRHKSNLVEQIKSQQLLPHL